MADQVEAPADPVPTDRRRRAAGTQGATTSPAVVSRRHRPALTVPLGTGGAVTTYYYRTSGGTFGSTTSFGAVPAGATILNRT